MKPPDRTMFMMSYVGAMSPNSLRTNLSLAVPVGRSVASRSAMG
jgi:hypothetical protein